MTVTALNKLRSYFVDRPLPDAVFEIAADYLSAIRVPSGKRTLRERVILPFTAGPVVASFDHANIVDRPALASGIDEAKRKLRLDGGRVALIVPDPSFRVTVLAVDALPASQAERGTFIRWRVAKQMPALPEDVRLDYAVAGGPASKKVMAALARASVVGEFEEIFARAGLGVGVVTVPSLSLVNLIASDSRPDGILLNIADDHMSLVAFMDAEWVLYRQKGIQTGGRPSWTLDQRLAQVGQELENTLHFLEDREQRKVEKVWVRVGCLENGGEAESRLTGQFSAPIELIENEIPGDWDPREKAILAPLMGQLR
jgi:hypothetical protein